MKKIKKTFTIGLLTLILLTGCAGDHTLENVKVMSKYSSGYGRYEIVVGKDKDSVTLRAWNYDDYRALNVGATINITYDSDFYIKHVSFPNMEKRDK